MRKWISAFRLRTLPLSFSLIIMGTVKAWADGYFSWPVFALALLTTLCLQILSNLANDYGDSQKGADNAERVGPMRAVQSKSISPEQMLTAIKIFAVMSLVSGLFLLWVADCWELLIAGIISIAAAVGYTMGKHPYGYMGLGDLSVFIFFGLVGVGGSYYLYASDINTGVVLLAISVGLLSVAVLNMNNMRDYQSDKSSGKRSLPVIMGLRWAKYYHFVVVTGSVAALLAYVVIFGNRGAYLAFLPFPMLVVNVVTVALRPNKSLDKQLPLLSFYTLLMVLCFAFGTIYL